MIGWDPKTEAGLPLPSAEVNSKKISFWAGFVAGGQTIAILLQVEDKRILRHEGPEFFKPVLKTEQSLVARERRKILQWNPVEKKYKISNFGAIFLYTQLSFTTLSLSIWRKDKSQEKTFIFMDCPIIICFDTLKGVYNCSKGIHVFLCYHVVYVVISCFFSASIRLMLSCLELSY